MALIKLKNSNPLVKYPVDADVLNHNFEELSSNAGSEAIEELITSSGQTYSTLFTDQLMKAVAQYVLSGAMFQEVGEVANVFVLASLEGLSLPYRYSNGMIVSFTPTRTNGGACTLGFSGLTAYPIRLNNSDLRAGYIQTGQINSFMLIKSESDTYWVPVTTAASESSSSETTSADAITFLKYLIQSANMSYDGSDVYQTSRAVSDYMAGIIYNASYNDGTFTLSPNELHYPVDHYFNGMAIMFVADATPDTAYPAVRIGNLSISTITSFNGTALPVGSIRAGQLCICRYVNGSFRLLSNYLPSFTMDGTRTITGVTNDTSLSSDSTTLIPTQHAVKAYVDQQTKGVDRNTITNAYVSGTTTKAIQQVGAHALQLVTAPLDENGEYTQTILEYSHTTPSQVIVSSNSDIKQNAIAKIGKVYWETEKTGWSIDDVKRAKVGTTGTYSIVRVEDEDSEYGYEFLHSPMATEYIGFTDLTALPDYFKIKFTDDNHAPVSVFLEVTTANAASGTWMTLGDKVVDEDATSESVVYVLDTSYGVLSDVLRDSDGSCLIRVPKYVRSGESIMEFNPGSDPFAIRVLFVECSNQYPTTDTIEADDYDPNNDETSEQYTVQVSEMGFGTLITAPDLTVSYYDGTVEAFTDKIYYTQFEDDTDTTENTVILSPLAAGNYKVFIRSGQSQLDICPYSSYFVQNTAPTASASTEGGVWVDTTTYPYTTWYCVGSQESEEEEEEIIYSWVKTNLIVLGEATVASNGFTSCTSYSMGNTKTETYTVATGAFNTHTLAHNFGADVTATTELVCTAANNGYAVGDRILLTPYQNTSYALDTSDVTPVLTQTNSFFSISYDAANATILYGNLQIVNKTTGSLVTVTANTWDLYVIIEKE